MSKETEDDGEVERALDEVDLIFDDILGWKKRP